MSGKFYLKDKLDDDELDLSMMQLTEIPVKEIEQLGNKVQRLNLSHNLLTSVPANLPLLAQLTHLDLSKNQIVDLPENFGHLVKLKNLDLYANKISRLPLGFAQLRSLKWLDLKENPLVPELANAAGPCVTKTECELAAKKVVARLQSIESQLFQEKKKRVEAEEKARKAAERKEERERERLRQEKKLAKEKRREEAKQKEMGSREHMNMEENVVPSNGNSPQKRQQNGSRVKQTIKSSSSGFPCLGLLLRLVLFLGVGCVALSVSLIWLYTDGRMDSESIQRAVPIIQKDAEATLVVWGDKSYKLYADAEKKARPYVQSSVTRLTKLSENVSLKSKQAYDWICLNYGDSIQSAVAQAKEILKLIWKKIEEAGKNLLPFLNRVWSEARPYFQKLGAIIVEKALEAWKFIQTNYPVYIEWLTATGYSAYKYVQTTFNTIAQAMN